MRNRPAKVNKIRVKRGKLEKREALMGVLFCVPWIIGAAVFLVYPIFTSLYYSLAGVTVDSVNGIMATPLNQIRWNNLQEKYVQVISHDQNFLPALLDYLVSTLVSVPVIVVFSMIIAMMLNQKIRGKGFFRMIFFLPVIIVSGPLLSLLSESSANTLSVVDTQTITGAIGSFLPPALATPVTSLFTNMVTILWYSGVPILIFISALQKIDTSQYEAAYVDGASAWEMFWKITLPALKPMILLNCVYTIVFISSNDQNSIIGLIKQAMISGTDEKGYDYAAAMAWIYAIVEVLLVGIFALIFMTRRDKYEKQGKKIDRQMRRERRKVLHIQRRQARHAKRYHRPTVR